MRVFVTGAAGYLGSAITKAFVEAGHQVTGLHHSEESEARVRKLGATPVLGEMLEPSTYESEAAGHDAYVHVAFDYENPVAADRETIEQMLRLTGGAGARPPQIFLYTSGCWVLGNTGEAPVDEESGTTDEPADAVAWRPEHEELVLSAGTDRVPTVVIRPGMVYGGSGGLVVRFFESAEATGAAEYVGDGENRWSLVHREDLGRLYVTIAEERAEGLFHGVAGVPVAVSEAARLASEAAGAGGETRPVPLEEAREELGPVADAMTLDQALETSRAGEVGWEVEHSSFPESVDRAYAEWKAAGA
ncbi:MAG: NAD-dependent epimerase/dehydratase family protein [Gemmatimonadota bacterium]|nr:NAD-dependent epimerase/dehydratase family protein [Gemmatimonadota bacterium]